MRLRTAGSVSAEDVVAKSRLDERSSRSIPTQRGRLCLAHDVSLRLGVARRLLRGRLAREVARGSSEHCFSNKSRDLLANSEQSTDMFKTRREVLQNLFVALPVGWVLVQAGCGTNSNEDCATANEVATTATAITVTSVCNEHTHDFTIMKTDLATPPTAGVSGNTTAYADDGHVHTMAITATDLANIQAGMTVTKTSGSALGHTHDFNFRLTA
jgi:hypothetical protein